MSSTLPLSLAISGDSSDPPAALGRGPQVELVRPANASVVRQWIALPPVSQEVPGASRHARRALMVEFCDAGIWCLRTPLAFQWNHARMMAAGVACAEAAGDPGSRLAHLAERLGETLDTTVELHLPTLVPDDLAWWKPRAFALELTLAGAVASAQGAASAAAQGLSALVDALEQSARSELATALHQFREGLDAEVWARVVNQDMACVRRYNLLMGGSAQRRLHRLQFAATFPVLFHALTAEPRPPGLPLNLLQLIDGGRPAVAFLARAFGVRKSTVRHLVGRPVSEVGSFWTAAPARLLAVLDAIAPEARPVTAERWHSLECMVKAADKAMQRPVRPAIVAAWYRSLEGGTLTTGHASVKGRLTVQGRSSLDEFIAQAGQVREFLDALTECLTLRADAHGMCQAADRGLSVRGLAEGVIARHSWKAVVAMAAAWRRAAHACRAEYAEMCERVLGGRFAPLLPRPTAFGERMVMPLTTAAELAQEGQALDHCVGQYAASCRQGESYIVGLRSGDGSRPISTAEFTLHADALGSVRAQLRQHFARADSDPGAACRAAIHDLQAQLQTSELQDHLRRLVRERGHIGRLSAGDEARWAAMLPNEEAFRRTLRPRGGYEGLVACLG